MVSDPTKTSSLVQVDGTISLSRFAETFDGTENLRFVGGLVIENSGTLLDLHGLSGLREIGENGLQISSTSPVTSITSLEGLHNLTRIEGDVRIADLMLLTSLDGLRSLEYVGGDFGTFLRMIPRSEIEAFLEGVEVRGDVTIVEE